jgi:hypothetical protein
MVLLTLPVIWCAMLSRFRAWEKIGMYLVIVGSSRRQTCSVFPDQRADRAGGGKITGAEFKGVQDTARQVLNRTRQRFNRNLCDGCYQKAVAAHQEPSLPTLPVNRPQRRINSYRNDRVAAEAGPGCINQIRGSVLLSRHLTFLL